MNTSILNEFLVLEETCSFSKAAKQLRMSQATLSRHILQFEEELGIKLFERTTQKVKLTAYGEALIKYAQSMLKDETAFKREIEKISFQSASHLIIGCVDFPFYYGITARLAEFKRAYPNARLDVRIESSDDLVKLLKSNQIDVAFIRNINHVASTFDSFLYAEDYMCIAIPENHPLADRQSANLSEFKDDIFYPRYEKDSLMNNLFNQMVQDAGFTPKMSSNCAGREDSVINDIKAVTTCTGGLADTFKGNVHVRVLELKPKYHADIYLAASLEKEHSNMVTSFMDFIRSCR